MKKKILILFSTVLCFFSLSTEVHAATTRYVNVCANNGNGTAITCAASGGGAGAYNTFTAAATAATAGDTIELCGGVSGQSYVGRTSSFATASTTVQGSKSVGCSGPVTMYRAIGALYAFGANAAGITINNMTFDGYDHVSTYGFALSFYNSSGTTANNITVINGAAPWNTSSSNSTSTTAMVVNAGASATINGLVATGVGNAGVILDNSTATVTINNCIMENSGGHYSRVIDIQAAGTMNINNCIMNHNMAGNIIGIGVSGATVNLTNSMLAIDFPVGAYPFNIVNGSTINTSHSAIGGNYFIPSQFQSGGTGTWTSNGDILNVFPYWQRTAENTGFASFETDDEPNLQYCASISAYMNQSGVYNTCNINKTYALTASDITTMQQLLVAGNNIGVHTRHHTDLSRTSPFTITYSGAGTGMAVVVSASGTSLSVIGTADTQGPLALTGSNATVGQLCTTISGWTHFSCSLNNVNGATTASAVLSNSLKDATTTFSTNIAAPPYDDSLALNNRFYTEEITNAAVDIKAAINSASSSTCPMCTLPQLTYLQTWAGTTTLAWPFDGASTTTLAWLRANGNTIGVLGARVNTNTDVSTWSLYNRAYSGTQDIYNMTTEVSSVSLRGPAQAVITSVSATPTTATYTAANTYSAGNVINISGLSHTALNGTSLTIATASSTQFTVTGSYGTVSSANDFGMAILNSSLSTTTILQQAARNMALDAASGQTLTFLNHNQATTTGSSFTDLTCCSVGTEFPVFFQEFMRYTNMYNIQVAPTNVILNTIKASGLWTTSDNSTYTRTFSGSADYHLRSLSPLIDVATSVPNRTTDIEGSSIYGSGSIGPYEYQPPHNIVTPDPIDIGAGARIYADGKFRDLGSTTSVSAHIKIVPQGGTFAGQTSPIPSYLDVTNITNWTNTQKTWTESNAQTSNMITDHTIGDLDNNTYYTIAITGASSSNISGINGTSCTNGVCLSSATGTLSFEYNGGYSTHTFTMSELSSAKSFFTFGFASPAATGAIDNSAHTIAITVPYGTNVTNLVPTFTMTGSSTSPASGVAQNFTSPVTYTVTAADTTTQAYIVTVTVASGGNHTITASSGLNGSISSTGTTSVSYGGSQSYTITPNSGYHVSSVMIDGSPIAFTGQYTFSNVTTDHTIAVTFDADIIYSSTSGSGWGSTMAVANQSNQNASVALGNSTASNGVSSANTISITDSGNVNCVGCTIVTTPPVGTNISVITSGSTHVIPPAVAINNSATTTLNKVITLNIKASKDIKKMAISLTKDFTNAKIENYTPINQIDLCPKVTKVNNTNCPKGVYTVYTKLYDASGTPSQILTDTVVLGTVATSSLYTFNRDLSVSMTGPDVKALQKFLNTNGFIIAKAGPGSLGKETATFGAATRGALINFQRSVGISASGFLGPVTRDYINSIR